MKNLLLVCALFFGMTAFSQMKIGHVNSQKLLDTLPSRKVALAKLDTLQYEGMKELQIMQKDLEAAYAKFQATEKDMSPVIKQLEQEKLMKKQQAIETRQGELEEELKIHNEELNKPILDRIQRAVEIIADRKKLNYIIDETVTLYFKGGIDCTQEVMVELLRLDAEAMKK